jgi:hypothetical protein
MQHTWSEVSRYSEAVGVERCVYALAAGGRVIGIWFCQRFGTGDPTFARANETMVEAWRSQGCRLFVTSLSPSEWERVVELNEDLRTEVQRQVA